jgi:hypothetical protein
MEDCKLVASVNDLHPPTCQPAKYEYVTWIKYTCINVGDLNQGYSAGSFLKHRQILTLLIRSLLLLNSNISYLHRVKPLFGPNLSQPTLLILFLRNSFLASYPYFEKIK